MSASRTFLNPFLYLLEKRKVYVDGSNTLEEDSEATAVITGYLPNFGDFSKHDRAVWRPCLLGELLRSRGIMLALQRAVKRYRSGMISQHHWSYDAKDRKVYMFTLNKTLSQNPSHSQWTL